MTRRPSRGLAPTWRAAWCLSVGAALGLRGWNAWAGAGAWGYDAWGHVAYVLFLDLYRGLPWADQGWVYFHPPLHYALAWPLAELGSADALLRGMALLGSAASLGTAGLAAWVVQRSAPGRPALAWLAFTALAFWPVHLYVSPMPGNKLTETVLSTAALASFVANERRARPGTAGDLLTGVLAGLALLAAFSGLLALLAVWAALPFSRRPIGSWRGHLARQGLRGAVIGGVALATCAPWYARNLATFGDPFRKSSDFPAMQRTEREQGPGERNWRDFLSVSPQLFREPDPLGPALYRSVWGTLYASAWADLHRESIRVRTPAERDQQRRWHARVLALGVLPTALALLGAGLAVRDWRRGVRRSTWAPVLALGAANALAFGAHAAWLPRWTALKAYYFLGASLAYGVCLARGAEAFGRGPPGLRALPVLAVSAAAALAAWVGLEGGALPARGDSPARAAAHFSLGEYAAAREIYGRLALGAAYPVPWLENLAAVELAEGDAAGARRLYARAVGLADRAGHGDPYRQGQLAVAMALAGDRAGARRMLDAALAERPLPELLANRGVLRALDGDRPGALADLRAALALEPELLPARLAHARLLRDAGRGAEAERALAAARRSACRAPRRHPHPLGSGEVLEWGVGRRWLLRLEDAEPRLALPDFFRGACRRLGAS